jgi:hypothetical protein
MHHKRTNLVPVGLALMVVAGTALADTFSPSSSGVMYALNDGSSFYVSSNPITMAGNFSGLNGDATAFNLIATNGDVGIVLYFNDTLKLGDLQSVSVTSIGTPLDVNLWLDTGNDGKFFSFASSDFSTPNLLTGLNGDSYASGPGSVTGSSLFEMIAGDGAGGSYTLSQLQGGTVSGIDDNTGVALWIGFEGAPGPATAEITSIQVSPEPPSQGQLTFYGFMVLITLGFKRLRPTSIPRNRRQMRMGTANRV